MLFENSLGGALFDRHCLGGALWGGNVSIEIGNTCSDLRGDLFGGLFTGCQCHEFPDGLLALLLLCGSALWGGWTLSQDHGFGIILPENKFFFQVFVRGFFKTSADGALDEFFFQHVIQLVLMRGVFQIFFARQADLVSAAGKGFELSWGVETDGAR
jgi:hypothetical protein